MSDAGVTIAFKSDHPVLNSQHLIFEAAKAHHYGLSASVAIQAVTSAPAKLMGQDWRIGHVRPGYDADLVLWDRFPLEIGAKPFRVFTDGLTTFKDANTEKVPFSHQNRSHDELKSCPPVGTSIRLHNLSNVYASEAVHIENDAALIVENGYVTCLGTAKDCPGKDGLLNIDGHGGSLVPVIFLADDLVVFWDSYFG